MSPNEQFRALSAKIGADALLVQGPGGNTSVKDETTLWIKASGTSLADAATQDIFVAVDLAKARAAIDDGSDGSCKDALSGEQQQLRPSIETTFHALLPHRYVFHYHSVRSIFHSICVARRWQLADALGDIGMWAMVGYHQPGVELTRAIRAARPATDCGIFVLENHGLIVADDDLERVAAQIGKIEETLDLPMETRPHPDSPALPGWQADPFCAMLATDQKLCEMAGAGSYYPDHVVFLGHALPRISLEELREKSPDDFAFPAVLVPGVGAYLKQNATAAQQAMLRCLAEVLSRLPDGWIPQPIGADAEAKLLDWDAEKYRQALAKRDGQ